MHNHYSRRTTLQLTYYIIVISPRLIGRIAQYLILRVAWLNIFSQLAHAINWQDCAWSDLHDASFIIGRIAICMANSVWGVICYAWQLNAGQFFPYLCASPACRMCQDPKNMFSYQMHDPLLSINPSKHASWLSMCVVAMSNEYMLILDVIYIYICWASIRVQQIPSRAGKSHKKRKSRQIRILWIYSINRRSYNNLKSHLQ
jgi:hypothetical protein